MMASQMNGLWTLSQILCRRHGFLKIPNSGAVTAIPFFEIKVRCIQHKASEMDKDGKSVPGGITAYEYLRKQDEERERLAKFSRSKLTRYTDVNEDRSYDEDDEGFQYTSKTAEGELYEKSEKDEFYDKLLLPKVYETPKWYKMTHSDVWNVLKRCVVHENDFILGLNKPYGLPMHDPAPDCHHHIIQFLPELAKRSNVPELFPLHRLDKFTTGVLMFAKDARVAKVLKLKFFERKVDKKYFAITKNIPEVLEATINIPIGEGKIPGTEKNRAMLRPDLSEFNIKNRRKSCREAITKYKVDKIGRDCAFVEMYPETGVKHQVRIHFGLGLGCPILGDHKYSHTDKLAPQRLPTSILHSIKVRLSKVRNVPLHLHCSTLSFDLPEEFTGSTDPVFVHARPPTYFMYTMERLGFKKRQY